MAANQRIASFLIDEVAQDNHFTTLPLPLTESTYTYTIFRSMLISKNHQGQEKNSTSRQEKANANIY